MNELDLFAAVIAIAEPGERAALLERECAGRPDLRNRIDQLVSAHFKSNALLDMPETDRTTPHASAGSETASLAIAAEVAGTVIAGRYKLLQQIGEGGMGSVWMADQTEPVKRRVAVKLIRVERGQSRTILSRFEAERQAIAVMDHPHIAKLLDAGTTAEGSPFFVMELVKGIPLNDYCDEHKLSIRDRLKLFMQICSAVQHAHQKGIIHRDLKPTNILVENHDVKPVPKVIDFGLAKATSGLQLSEHTLFTAFGSVMGTPLYMAPEQANFSAVDVDTRADVYALGVILYELLTGTTPITRESMKKAALEEMLKLIREQDAPTPSSRLSTSESKPSIAANRQMEPQKLGRFIKGELDWIVMKALSKERDRRYETATGFARDVERFLNNEAVAAGPPSTSYRLRKFVKRNRGQVIAASLILLALLAGLAGTGFGLIRAERQRLVAERAAMAERLAKQEAEARREEAETQQRRAEAGEKLASERLVQVEAEKKKTEEEKKIAVAVKDFLQNKLLGQADVRTQADALLKAGALAAEAKTNPTIGELLDRAAVELSEAKIEANFPDQPQLQAELLFTVGNTYGGVGAYERAIGFLQRSVALFKQHLGADHPHTLTSMNILASAYEAAGKLNLALPLFEETLKLRKAKLGPDHPHTLTSMANLAWDYQAAGKPDLALPLDEETLKLMKAKLGPDDPNTLQSMNSLASAYFATGKLDLALPLLEETLKLKKAKLGPDHPHTLTSMNNLASAYQAAGKLDLALLLHEETLKLKKAKLGPDHPETLMSMGSLAMANQAAGKLDLALPLFEETLKLMKAKLGPDHPHTLTSMNNLAWAYHAAGKLDLALPLHEETLKLMKAKLGPDHPDTLRSMNNVASAYQAAGKLDLALRLHEETLKLMKARLGPDHPHTLTSMNNLAVAYDDAGKLDLALPLHEETLKLKKAKLGPDHPDTLLSMNNLALAYKAAGKLDQALPLFEETLKLRKAKLGPDHPDTLLSMDNLGWAYQANGKLELALPLFEETLKLRKAKLGPDHPRTLKSMNDLASAYEDAGKLDLALPLFEETLKLRKAKLGPDHPDTANTMASLGSLLIEKRLFTEAEPLLRECLAIREKTKPDAWTTFNTSRLLGSALLGQKKYAEAEPLLLKAYEGMKQREKSIPKSGGADKRVPEALDALIELYTATNKPEEVKKWQAERAKYPEGKPAEKK
jgi:eukaryotic-like serine/threonine-protein kinase